MICGEMFMPKDYLTVREVAKSLNVAEYTVRQYLRKGQLRGTKIAGWRVKPADLVAFIRSRTNVDRIKGK
jgi:excisionase family DNA binding protein